MYDYVRLELSESNETADSMELTAELINESRFGYFYSQVLAPFIPRLFAIDKC